MDNLYARPVLLKKLIALSGDIVMVSPDAGGVERARAASEEADLVLYVIDGALGAGSDDVAFLEALEAAGDKQGWLGYNRLFESNIRKTGK